MEGAKTVLGGLCLAERPCEDLGGGSSVDSLSPALGLLTWQEFAGKKLAQILSTSAVGPKAARLDKLVSPAAAGQINIR